MMNKRMMDQTKDFKVTAMEENQEPQWTDEAQQANDAQAPSRTGEAQDAQNAETSAGKAVLSLKTMTDREEESKPNTGFI